VSTFLTVKEASQLTGKSPSSIRRVIYPIIHDEKHPDRQQVQPSPEEALALRMKGENFAWKLSEELLRREVPLEEANEKVQAAGSTAQRGGMAGESELLSMLRRELEIKNQQITQQAELLGKQMELISGLSERLREGNVLIGSLQQRLGMPGKQPETAVAQDAEAKEKSSPPKPKSPKPTAKLPKSKKGFLRRMFS
jgi:hypothetical protein